MIENATFLLILIEWQTRLKSFNYWPNTISFDKSKKLTYCIGHNKRLRIIYILLNLHHNLPSIDHKLIYLHHLLSFFLNVTQNPQLNNVSLGNLDNPHNKCKMLSPFYSSFQTEYHIVTIKVYTFSSSNF